MHAEGGEFLMKKGQRTLRLKTHSGSLKDAFRIKQTLPELIKREEANQQNFLDRIITYDTTLSKEVTLVGLSHPDSS